MTAINKFDHILKNLGELYEFNREIRRFEFVESASYGAIESPGAVVAEDSPEYKTGNE